MPQAGKSAASGPHIERAFANLRHDLRTFLNAILGYTALWVEDPPADSVPQIAETLADIHAQGEWLLRQVNELMAPSHLADPAYTAGLAERMRNVLNTRIQAVIASTEGLRAAISTGPQELVADLAKVQTAAEALLTMLKGVESVVGDSYLVAEQSLTQANARVKNGAGSRVLVVDDNDVNRDVLSRRLQREGYAVSLAEDGSRALAMLEAESFDLVLLDIMMPLMNGYEVLQRIRSETRWFDLPVIMISSVDEMDSIVRCIEMGADDYLPKPFNPVLLRARVGAYLEKKRLREERAAKQKAEAERLRWELDMAGRVQQRLLPVQFPQIAGFDLAGTCLPARSVGGDYFDFLVLDDFHLGLVMADVQGKGIPAALVMATLVASLRSQARPSIRNLARLMRVLNLQIHDWTETGKFVSLFYACLDLRNRQLRYVNAGHLMPLLVRGAKREIVTVPDVGGPVLGVLPEAAFEEGAVQLETGDVLVAYTDGVTEAFNAQDEEFGDERLVSSVLRNLEQSSADICTSVADSVRAWSVGVPQSDDITLSVVKFH